MHVRTFMVILSGSGIDLRIDGVPVVGFFTGRRVRAPSLSVAEGRAREDVLAEWRAGGTYAEKNSGGLPLLTVSRAYRIGSLAGIFGRKPGGYTFYSTED